MSDPVTQLHEAPKPDSALMRSLPAAAGAAAGKAVGDAATGGLKGAAAVIANISAVTFLFAITWFMYRDMSASMKEDRQMFREEMRAQRDSDSKLREASNAELRGFATEFRAGMTEFRAILSDMRRSTRELKDAGHPE